MLVSQKCQYALRAIFELARRSGEGPVRISAISSAQAIPARFLEVILNQLKQGSFIESRRGSAGGYFLVRSPADLSVGEVMRFIQGPLGPVECVAAEPKGRCPLHDDCVFLPMWEQARVAMSNVYDGTTFQDLLDRERQMRAGYVPGYTI